MLALYTTVQGALTTYLLVSKRPQVSSYSLMVWSQAISQGLCVRAPVSFHLFFIRFLILRISPS